jgi:hypothetical protein
MGNYELTKIWDLEFVDSEGIESRIDWPTGRVTGIHIGAEECVYILPDGVPCRIRNIVGENINSEGIKWYQIAIHQIAIPGMSIITASTQGVNEVLEREIIKRTVTEWETIN